MNASEQNKQNQQERVIPKLRFPEFQTALGWQSGTLNQIASRVIVKNKTGEITRIFTNSANDGIVDQSDYFDREIANKDNLNGYYIVEIGDYVYNPRISTAAPAGPISKNKIAKGVMSPLYTVFRFHQIRNDFYEYYFKTNYWHKYLYQVSNSGARHDRMNITNDDFMSMPVPILSIEEQQKIADCLFSLDELIELQEQKLATLKQHKKGLMQQLFPSHHALQAGRVVYPKLRFPQFRNCKGWEVVELGSLFNLNHTNERIDLFDKNKVLTVKLHTLGVVKNERTDTLSGGANYFHRRAGDFIFSKIDFLNGAFGIIPQELDGFCSSSDIPTFSFKKESNPEFFIYWLKANYLNLNIERTGTSNTLKRISTNALFSMRLPIPIPKEQQAIADCLSSLDNLINEQNERIGRLKTHKKGLMQQLFPST
ncbi:restriction endonuclease subunit S [Glaesserella parasuis]|nr:restriction endonuclease subunit S [Glaesserella parasuis]